MKSSLPVMLSAILLIGQGLTLAESSSAKPRVSLRPDIPIRFVAGEMTELSFEVVLTDPDGESRVADVDAYASTAITAELSFFCFGGQKIYHRVVTLQAHDGSFTNRITVPGVAMSGDVSVAISSLPDDVESEFRELHPVVIDQTVERPNE